MRRTFQLQEAVDELSRLQRKLLRKTACWTTAGSKQKK